MFVHGEVEFQTFDHLVDDSFNSTMLKKVFWCEKKKKINNLEEKKTKKSGLLMCG